MAKGRSKQSAVVNRAAEGIGHALGSIAGTIDSLQTQHPHPVDDAREALIAGQKTLAAATTKASRDAAAMIKKAKGVAGRAKKAVTRARPKRAPVMARATRAAESAVTRAKKAVTRGRKAVERAARRLKR